MLRHALSASLFISCISYPQLSLAQTDEGRRLDSKLDRSKRELRDLQAKIDALNARSCMKGPKKFGNWTVSSEIVTGKLILTNVTYRPSDSKASFAMVYGGVADTSAYAKSYLAKPSYVIFPIVASSSTGYSVRVSSPYLSAVKLPQLPPKAVSRGALFNVLIPPRYYSAFRQNHGSLKLQLLKNGDEIVSEMTVPTDKSMDAFRAGNEMHNSIIRDVAVKRCKWMSER